MLALVVTSLLCGESIGLQDKVFKASTVVEFTLRYQGKARPIAQGRMIFPPDSQDLRVAELQLSFTAGSKCLALARKKKQLKLLAFFDEKGKQLVGVEQDRGWSTELDPAYPSMVEAVLEAKSWHDERMRAVGVDQLWLQPKKALGSDNPYLRRLAADFLKTHQADVVDAAWGPVGSEARKKNEALATIQATDLCATR